MSGRINGVQPKLKAECSQLLHVHCCCHVLDLVQGAQDVNLRAEVLNFVQGVAVVIGESHKRKTLFKLLFASNEVAKSLLSFCPTRWNVCTPAIARVLATYPILLETLSQLEIDKSMRGEARARIGGLYTQSKQSTGAMV